ncbi:MAG: MFS transporter [Bacteroidota bacterium]
MNDGTVGDNRNHKISKADEIWVLVATILPSSMAFIDSTALNVVLPSLQEEFGADGSILLWVINSYTLFLSALLLSGGAMGDIYGRKKLFTIGIIIFLIGSLLCGLASSPLILIVSRCIQGAGGALMVPGSLSILSALFPAERRGWAIGTWSMFSAMTTILGPALGGYLADIGLWRGVFFINLPLGVVALLILAAKVPESREQTAKKPDILGAIAATIALAGITFGFIEAPEFGIDDPLIIASLALGGLSLIAFLFIQNRITYPMMPLKLFRSGIFSSTNLMTLFIYAGLAGFLFFFPLNLIQVQGYSPKIAGFTMLPFGLLISLLSFASGAISDRIGTRLPLIIGPILTAIGFFLFSITGITNGPVDYWSAYFPAILLLGIGMGITVAPLTTAVMGAVPDGNAGIASGVNNTIARTAGVLAIAIMGALAISSFETSLLERTANIGLSEVQLDSLSTSAAKLAEAEPPSDVTAIQKDKIEGAIKHSFLDVFRQSALIATILVSISALIAFFTLRPSPRTEK